MIRLALILLTASIGASGCELLVAAAADLAPLEAALTAGARQDTGCSLRFTFASSGTLARQIRAGADFDVYLAANRAFVEDLVRDGFGDRATITPYARGRIALWSASGVKWEDLTTPRVRRLALANPALAPFGLAARQALERRGLWKAVEPKVVYGENIRQAWQFARSGNVDAGIVSWTLAQTDRAHAWLIPEAWHDPVEQTGVIPKGARHPADGRKFLVWLRSASGQKALQASIP